MHFYTETPLEELKRLNPSLQYKDICVEWISAIMKEVTDLHTMYDGMYQDCNNKQEI